MKRTLRPLLLLAFVLGCGGEEPAPPAAPTSFKLESGSPEQQLIWHVRERITTRRPDEMVRAVLAETEEVPSDARRGWGLAVPGRWESDSVELPAAATLHFATRLDAPDLGSAFWPVALRMVFAADDGSEPVELWVRQEAPSPPDGGPWRDWSVDLGALAGRTGAFALEASSTAGALDDLRVALAQPAVAVATDDRPNVLFITVDTLRRDRLSPWGGPPEATPELAELCARGVVVERSWSTASWTLPSYASLFTAEYPSTHGAGIDWTTTWEGGAPPMLGPSPELGSLTSYFDRAGYHTRAWHDNANLRLGTGIDRGFDSYAQYGLVGRTAVRQLERWLPTVGERPFFAFVHLADPHSPYVPPAGFEAPAGTPDPTEVAAVLAEAHRLREEGVPEEERDDLIALYDAMVAYTDELVGELVDALERRGLAEDTLIVFHADHGEELWDHGEWFHGHGHHVELIATPLAFVLPGVLPAGTRVGGDFRGVDVLPTVLDLVGLWDGAPTEGRSLAATLRGEEGPAALPALSESPLFGTAGDWAVTAGSWRLLVTEGAEPRLYHTDDDPSERDDVAAEHPAVVEDLLRIGRDLRRRAEERRLGPGAEVELDAAAAAQLGHMGYGGGD